MGKGPRKEDDRDFWGLHQPDQTGRPKGTETGTTSPPTKTVQRGDQSSGNRTKKTFQKTPQTEEPGSQKRVAPHKRTKPSFLGQLRARNPLARDVTKTDGDFTGGLRIRLAQASGGGTVGGADLDTVNRSKRSTHSQVGRKHGHRGSKKKGTPPTQQNTSSETRRPSEISKRRHRAKGSRPEFKESQRPIRQQGRNLRSKDQPLPSCKRNQKRSDNGKTLPTAQNV